MGNLTLILDLTRKSIRDYREDRIGLGILVTEIERIVDHAEIADLSHASELRGLWGELEIIYSLYGESDLASHEDEINSIIDDFAKILQLL